MGDAADGLLFSLRSAAWRNQRTATFPNGGELTIRGRSWHSRDWVVEDAGGTAVLQAAATATGWSLHPDAYAVQVDSALSLAQVIGIVQANRIMLKSRRAGAVAAGV